MLRVVPEAEVQNDTGTYYKLDNRLEPLACNKTEWDAFRASGAANVATTNLGEFGSVVTTFEGDDEFDEDDPHFFMTMVYRNGHSEAEGHRTWREAEAAHRQRVDDLKAELVREQREREPELAL